MFMSGVVGVSATCGNDRDMLGRATVKAGIHISTV